MSERAEQRDHKRYSSRSLLIVQLYEKVIMSPPLYFSMSCGSTKDGPSQMGGLWEIWWRRLQWRGEGATTPKSDTFMPRGLCEAPCPCVASCL